MYATRWPDGKSLPVQFQTSLGFNIYGLSVIVLLLGQYNKLSDIYIVFQFVTERQTDWLPEVLTQQQWRCRWVEIMFYKWETEFANIHQSNILIIMQLLFVPLQH